jgi:alpha-galactosidase
MLSWVCFTATGTKLVTARSAFSEAVLAKPAPDAKSFPYVSWDSWAYGEQIDEQTLMRNADVAASVGVELFIVDLGWARAIGDWYEDLAKFPHGLAALSYYVHSLGMKFGLHFALTEADPASPVLQANPDWTSTESDNYFGASSLCLSNQPTRDWLIQEGIRIIDQYNVDWILQDGQNMVKQCTKTTHTHDPNDSNYANAVDGLNAVVSAIQAARPNVYWENCEDGGSMMTFNMVKSYVTSITNDASGSLASRRAVYGATYPFSPRFADRYMPDSDGLDSYATGSYMFGGNWVLMNSLTDLTPDQVAFLGQQIGVYKSQRADIAAGKVYHILPPAANGTDVIQSYNPATDNATAVVTRADSDGASYVFRPLGLVPDQRYAVWFANDPSIYLQTGSQLMQGRSAGATADALQFRYRAHPAPVGCGAGWYPARRLFTGATGGLPTRRRLTICPTTPCYRRGIHATGLVCRCPACAGLPSGPLGPRGPGRRLCRSHL